MEFWEIFWTIVLIGSFGIFTVLAITVTVGAFFNILSLLKKLKQQSSDDTERKE